jgi:hypothetical protein
MKFRKGLVVGLGLALSLQSVVVFADDFSSVATVSTAVVAESPTAEEPTAEAPTAEAPTSEEPTAEAPTAEVPTEQTAEAPTAEAPTEQTAEAPTAEEPTAEAPTAEAPTAEAPTAEQPVVVEPVVVEPVVEILDNQVPLAGALVPEVKANATLLITNKLQCDDGELICQQEIKDLVAGTTVDIAEYVDENEDVKAVNGTGTIELVEGQNEIVIEYRFESDMEEEINDDTVADEYAGELMR